VANSFVFSALPQEGSWVFHGECFFPAPEFIALPLAFWHDLRFTSKHAGHLLLVYSSQKDYSAFKVGCFDIGIGLSKFLAWFRFHPNYPKPRGQNQKAVK